MESATIKKGNNGDVMAPQTKITHNGNHVNSNNSKASVVEKVTSKKTHDGNMTSSQRLDTTGNLLMLPEHHKSPRQSKTHQPVTHRDHYLPQRPARHSVGPSMKYGFSNRPSQDITQKVVGPQRRSMQTLSRFGTSMSLLMGMRRRKGGPGSKSSNSNKDKKPVVANTYKLPEQGQEFNPRIIEALVKEIVESRLQYVRYNSLVGDLAMGLSDLIQGKVKELNMPRYKIVCQVIIGQNHDQGLEIASRCLWDSQKDNCACVTYHNETLSAVVSVHGIYFE